MDEVRLYSVALSSAQILADYESDTLAAQNTGTAYNVLYSTTAGVSWNSVAASSVTRSGGSGLNGDTASENVTVTGLALVTSTGTAAPTNQVAFTVSDMAGNVSTAAFTVLVDTTAPTSPNFTMVASSITFAWTPNTGATTKQYSAQVSTNSTNFTIGSTSATYNTSLTTAALNANTTYYFRAANVNNSLYTTVIGTSTLAVAVSTNAINVYVSSISVSWAALPASPSSATAEGYILTASTASNFTGTIYSSSTPNVAQSTLTITGLTTLTTYYLEVGALNWNSVANYVALGSTYIAPPALSGILVSAVYTTSVTVTYTGNGAAGYVVRASTASNFTGVVTSSSDPSALSLSPQGLYPNTTYYLQAGALWNQTTCYANAAPSSTSTLASAPSRLASDYVAVYYTSATLNWAALPQSPSSQTCEGYLLEASTAPDFSGTIYSSSTPNVALSTLSITGMAFNTTWYFQVGSLNSNSAWNPVALTQLNVQLNASTTSLSLGTLNVQLFTSTISISSFVVTNLGSLPFSYVIWATTMTPSSPWTLGVSSDIEQVYLQGLWNTSQPAASAFMVNAATNTAITNSTTTSTSANYAGNQTGVSVPSGQSRTMWFQFWRPTSTSCITKQTIQINVLPIYP